VSVQVATERADSLPAGFSDPVSDAQATFRGVLKALSEPGTIVELPVPAEQGPLPPAMTALLLTLADVDTAVWLDASARPAANFIRFHCGAPIVDDVRKAAFACLLEPYNAPSLCEFALGSDAYPDGSSTLWIEIADLTEGGGLKLQGPGIDGQRSVGVTGLPERILEERARLVPLFPRGLDIVLSCGDRIIGLPRTTKVEG
jgi:alpha-D-ribose 1-methylphosphonate 5-triphosphate synthase subunit PhnH